MKWLIAALLLTAAFAQSRNSPYLETYGAIQLQALEGGVPSGPAGPSGPPQFLLMVDGINRVLQTDGVSKICLANTC